MKTKLLFVTLLLLSLNIAASNPVRFGIILGPNYKALTEDGDVSNIKNFHVGGTAEIPIFTKNTYLNPSIQIQIPVGGTDRGTDMSDVSANLPLFLEYKNPINNKISSIVATGATFSMVQYATDQEFRHPFDFAVGVKAGIEIAKHYQFSVGYDFGLVNLDKNGHTMHSRNLKLSFAYFFGRK